MRPQGRAPRPTSTYSWGEERSAMSTSHPQPTEPLPKQTTVTGADTDGRAVPNADDAVTLVGRGQDVPEPAAAVLEVEGSLAEEAPAQLRTAEVTTWLFQPNAAPTPFTLADLPQVVANDANFAWIDLSEYTEEQLCQVASLVGLHSAAVRLALSRWQRPRLEVFQDNVYVSATVARLDASAYRVHAGQLDLFFGHNFFISAHKRPLPFAASLAARARQSPELVQLDAAYMLYLVLDELLEYYEDLVERVEDEIEGVEQRALTEPSARFLAELLDLKRYVFALSRMAEQHREVFAALLRPDFRFVSGDELERYFRDLDHRLGSLLGVLGAAKDSVNGAFDIYVSHTSHRTNQIMKILTMVSTILLPTTVILGFFSTQIEGLPFYAP